VRQPKNVLHIGLNALRMQVGVAEIRLPVAGMQQIEIAWPWPYLDHAPQINLGG
jgi:hypothetical protein